MDPDESKKTIIEKNLLHLKKYKHRYLFVFIALSSILLILFYILRNSVDSKASGSESIVNIQAEDASLSGPVVIVENASASNGKFIEFGEIAAVTPTPTTVFNPTATPIPTKQPTATLPPVKTGSGIWISTEEIMALPTTGSAWNSLVSHANSDWGVAHLEDNNSNHDVNTLAGALVAVRTNNSTLRQKTIDGLISAQNEDTLTELARSLELSRGLQTYIIAADIIGYRTPAFESWVRAMLNIKVSPHTGGSELCNSAGLAESCSSLGGLVCTALRAANNWGGHARASAIAGALYLNDQQLLARLVNAHKAYIGENVQNNLYCQSTNWHASSSERYGVNKAGTQINGVPVSGVIPEDWRRGSEFVWPPVKSGYMWEGMQGYVVSAVMLHRAGKVPFNAGDNAVVRSMDMLKTIGYAAESDDTWIPWLVNYYAGTSYNTVPSIAGKNMGYTDWTHSKK